MGSTRTETINVDTPDTTGPYRLELAMGAGTLKLSPGAGSTLVQGTVTYNVDDLKPIVTTSGNRVRIDQGRTSVSSLPRDIKNDWDLRLGDAPMALKLSVGAAKGQMELGGLSLTELDIAQGASDFTLAFSQPNAVPLDTFHVSAGAAKSAISGLGNVNAGEMNFEGGAGEFSLAFGGDLRRELRVSISAAAGNVIIDVPSGRSANVSMKGVLAKVDSSGEWSGSGNVYRLAGGGPEITISANISVGRLELRSS